MKAKRFLTGLVVLIAVLGIMGGGWAPAESGQAEVADPWVCVDGDHVGDLHYCAYVPDPSPPPPPR